MSNRIPSCKMLAAQMLQKRMLRRSRELGYDETTIQLLLEANSVIGREHLTARDNIAIRRLLQDVQSLKIENIWLQYNVDKLKFYRGLDSKEKVLSQSEEFFVANLLRLVPIGVSLKTTLHVDPAFVKNTLRQLTKTMSRRERLKLQKSAHFTDEEEAVVNENADDLLVKMYEKDLKQSRSGIDLDEWLPNVLAPLQNRKIVEKAFELFYSHEINIPRRKHKATSKAEQNRKRRATAEGAEKGAEHTKKTEYHAEDEADSTECDSGFGEAHGEDLKSKVNILTNLVCSMKTTLASLDRKMGPCQAVPNLHDGNWKDDVYLG